MKTTLLFDRDRIAGRVDDLARDIVSALGEDFVIVGLLKGSFVFVADLVRALDRVAARPRVEFMRLSSYGLGRQSAGEVHLLGDIPVDIAGRTILLVDDIVDTGRSVAYALALLRQRDAGQIRTCALVDKPSRREVDVPVDFVGFTVGDVFIAGYGIDYAERFRHFPDIRAVSD
ncbi:MAG: hypoxanthine phosphoribosyltransferase [Rhodospirillaceae bacterium]|nr:hypoxanthine phosphoribosyltransferase [Rhodospirillaceae bacterium]